MAVTVAWLDAEHSILKFALYGKWTWDETYQAFEAGIQLANSVKHDVYAIAIHADETACHHVPPSVIAHFPQLARRIPDNMRTQVIVFGEFASLWRAIYQSVRAIYPSFTQYMTIATSEEEALQIIQDLKATHALASGS